ncbi:hypothetical protein Moror_10086 [Moniliophthora roreri MCA 2997]|uniref:DUF6533 domain-containing protein n=1 Tax=Moniliophthora roreri (strain MCA 2997) TaxID=1381753 RepID=V2Y1L2_MONRO|nr:hypothetical protein Moror_10086 [Moniliophthora roreri MCA 2997]
MQDCITTAASEVYPAEAEVIPPAAPPYLVVSYIAVGTLGMFLWDILTHLEAEYELLLKQKITLTTIVYFWSRLNALINIFSSALVYTAPLDQYCSGLSKFTSSGFTLVITSISLLLFLRVRAVYTENRPVMAVFFVAFLAVMGLSTLSPFVGSGQSAGPQNPYCTTTKSNIQLGVALLIVPLVNNIAVFVAITIKLLPKEETATSHRDTMSRIRRFLRGKHLPGLSRTLWQDGQKYLLASILTTSTVVVVLCIDSIPKVYGFTLITPHVAIENSMSSYMIRSIRASILKPDRNMVTTLNLHTTPELEFRREGPVLSQ